MILCPNQNQKLVMAQSKNDVGNDKKVLDMLM